MGWGYILEIELLSIMCMALDYILVLENKKSDMCL